MFALNILDIANSGIGGNVSFLQVQIGHVRLAAVSVNWIHGLGIQNWDCFGLRELYHIVACKHGFHCNESLPSGEQICIHCGEVTDPLLDHVRIQP